MFIKIFKLEYTFVSCLFFNRYEKNEKKRKCILLFYFMSASYYLVGADNTFYKIKITK